MSFKKLKNIVRSKNKKESNEIAEGNQFDVQVEEAISQSQILAQKKKLKKTRIKQAAALVVLALVSWLGVYLFTPNKGTVSFGVCKVFLELTVRFPDQLRLNSVEIFRNSHRIWYTQIDPFGAHRLEPIQCYYKYDKNMSLYILDKVTIRRRELDPAIIEAFNKTVPILHIYQPDLSYPSASEDSLEDLYFEVDKYRKRIF